MTGTAAWYRIVTGTTERLHSDWYRCLGLRSDWVLGSGGILGSVMFYMAIASLANLFLGWHIIQEVQIYLGLLVFSGYVVFDTQVIIEKASQGQTDVVKHSLELFIDFAAIFVRILIILMRNKESDDRRKRNRN